MEKRRMIKTKRLVRVNLQTWCMMILGTVPFMVQGAVDNSENFLKTNGRKICKNMGSGIEVPLRGVNVGSWMLRETWIDPLNAELDENGEYNPWPLDADRTITCDQDARDTLRSRFGLDSMELLYDAYQDTWIQEADWVMMGQEGYNCVRLPLFYVNLMNEDGTWKRNQQGEIDFSRIDWAVHQAALNGMYTLIDLHGAPGSQNGDMHSGNKGTAELYWDETSKLRCLEWWREVALHFKDVSAVAGYDALNEPSENFPGGMGSNVIDMYKRIYTEIRSVDPDHIIFFESIWSLGNIESPASYGWENVVYELHHYEWGNLTANGQINSWNGKIGEVNSRQDWNVPVIFGEVQLFDDPLAWESVLGTLNSNGIGWMMWNWKMKNTNWSWGVYTGLLPDTTSRIPNLLTDSFDQIKFKWSCWETVAYFTRNSRIANKIKAACTGIPLCEAPTAVAVVNRIEAAPIHAGISRVALSAGSLSLDIMTPGGEASIALLDLHGALVRTLYRGELPAGQQRIAGKERGVLCPGTYLLQLTTRAGVAASQQCLIR